MAAEGSSRLQSTCLSSAITMFPPPSLRLEKMSIGKQTCKVVASLALSHCMKTASDFTRFTNEPLLDPVHFQVCYCSVNKRYLTKTRNCGPIFLFHVLLGLFACPVDCVPCLPSLLCVSLRIQQCDLVREMIQELCPHCTHPGAGFRKRCTFWLCDCSQQQST